MNLSLTLYISIKVYKTHSILVPYRFDNDFSPKLTFNSIQVVTDGVFLLKSHLENFSTPFFVSVLFLPLTILKAFLISKLMTYYQHISRQVFIFPTRLLFFFFHQSFDQLFWSIEFYSTFWKRFTFFFTTKGF